MDPRKRSQKPKSKKQAKSNLKLPSTSGLIAWTPSSGLGAKIRGPGGKVDQDAMEGWRTTKSPSLLSDALIDPVSTELGGRHSTDDAVIYLQHLCYATETQCELQSVSARPVLIAASRDGLPRCPQATASSTEPLLLLIPP